MANPFRQSPAPSKEAVLYDDIQSARCAILSGSARNRHASAKALGSSSSGSGLDISGEIDAIPMQELKPLKDLPLPPVPAKISNIPRVEIGLEYTQVHNAKGMDTISGPTGKVTPSALVGTSSVFPNIKTALVSTLSPLARDSESSEMDNNKISSNKYRDLKAGGSMYSTSEQYSVANIREGSTVGNIYRLYARSVREEAEAEGYKALSPIGSLTEKLIAPSTPPPRFPLPSLPGLDELLSENTRTPLNKSSGIFSEAGNSTVPSLPKFSPKNPFRARSRSSGRSGGRSAIVSFADDGHCVYVDHVDAEAINERLPLEREVSEALRRASGFSFYSMGSISSSILEPGQRFLDQAYDQPPLTHSYRPQKLKGILAADHQTPTKEQIFYNQNALVPEQTSRQHSSIRLPILHNGTYPDSPPDSPAHFLYPPVTRRSDLQEAFLLSPLANDQTELNDPRQKSPDDDWETVGESAFGLDGRHSRDYTPTMFGTYGNYGASAIHRAGSSIANTSDAGSLSINIREVDHFNSSTDRIAQHPAKIEYSSDYRLRELKRTNMPILLPSYKDHKVNGYLANSSRVAPNPAQWFRSDLKPIKQPHRHPFKTTPPEVASPHPSMPKSDRKKVNHFPRLSKVMRQENLRSFSSDSRPSSWQHIMTFANGGTVLGFNEDGSRKGSDENTAEPPHIHPIEDGPQSGAIKRNIGSERSLHERLERRPLVRGPPGAFYQGLRSDGKRKVTGPHQELKPTRPPSRHGTKEYPTNELRPLSLSFQFEHSGTHRSLSQGSNSHFYRSPLTPPQRQTWRDLYTSEQMEEIERAAEQSASDRRRTEQWLNSSMKCSTMDDMAPRKFFEAPTLHPPTRDSIPGSLSTTKDSVSIAVLFFCAFFPPLLGLYLVGHLNGVMRWATSGECSSFTKRGMKLAKALLLCWVFGAVVGLVVFVSWWFTIRKRR